MVAEYERNLAANTHTLAGTPLYRERSVADQELTAEATVHVLGGGDPGGAARSLSTAAERRQVVLEATLRRLKAQEKEIEDMCGNTQDLTGTDGEA